LNDLKRLQSHRAITILTQGHSDPFVAKTAMSLLRYRNQDMVAVLDGTVEARTADELFRLGGSTPIVRDLLEVSRSDALYIGIAPPGGRLPVEWKPIILTAIDRKMDIVSGLHDFLNDVPEYVSAAREARVQLIDVRANSHVSIAKSLVFEPGCLRIHSVGQDCSVGKMVATLEIHQGLLDRGSDSAFLATGQTGIMITGQGLPIDRVIVDFVNGAAEQLVADNQHHEFLLIEGQGSISHPAYSAVTLGLLHGCAPQGLIYCYEAGRQNVKGLADVALPTMASQMEAYLVAARLRHPSRFIGCAVNTRNLSDEAASAEVARVERETGLPACDVYRHGAGKLVDACVNLKKEITTP
jgi:uncharacterized NAD-dependent epimerase/dehydratase family protein